MAAVKRPSGLEILTPPFECLRGAAVATPLQILERGLRRAFKQLEKTGFARSYLRTAPQAMSSPLQNLERGGGEVTGKRLPAARSPTPPKHPQP